MLEEIDGVDFSVLMGFALGHCDAEECRGRLRTAKGREWLDELERGATTPRTRFVRRMAGVEPG